MRPAPGYADYRTPIRGLYQASSATHGGGGVCGIPGYNAFRQIDKDRARTASAPRRDEHAMTEQNRSFPFYFASWYKKSPYFDQAPSRPARPAGISTTTC